MFIIQIALCFLLGLCGFFLIRIGGLLLKKVVFYKSKIKSGSSIFEILSMPSMLLAVLLMKHSNSIIPLCLLTTCLAHNEICWLMNKNLKKCSKILTSIGTFICLIIYTLCFFSNYEGIWERLN